jgi:acyl carrier protein
VPELEDVFRSALELGPDVDVTVLTYTGHEHWDSVGHMALVAEIEEAYGLLLDTDDVLNLSSYTAALELLERHGVVVG